MQKVSLEDLFSQIQAGERKELAIIVKADVQGSVEAVKASLEKLSNDEVNVRVIHGAVGAINDSDVMLASSSNAIIVGFNVRPDAAARDGAARQNVDMRMYRVIYDCINEVEAAMKGMLAPQYREVVLGHAEVRETYKVSSIGTIAGCYVTDGKIVRNASVRLVRDGIVVHEGALASLQRFKDSVKEVNEKYECGMTIDKFNDIKVGDVIEAYTMEEIPRSTDPTGRRPRRRPFFLSRKETAMNLLLSHIEPYLSFKTYVLLVLFLMVFNFIRSCRIPWRNLRRMEKTLKMPDGEEFLSALEELLQEKKDQRPQEMSAQEHEFLARREHTKEEENPFVRMEQDRELIAFVRSNEREFR